MVKSTTTTAIAGWREEKNTVAILEGKPEVLALTTERKLLLMQRAQGQSPQEIKQLIRGLRN